MDRSGSISPKAALAIAALAVAVPLCQHTYDNHFYMTGPLTYSSDGIKCDAKKCELAVWVRNDGYSVDEGLKFELPSRLDPAWIYVSGRP